MGLALFHRGVFAHLWDGGKGLKILRKILNMRGKPLAEMCPGTVARVVAMTCPHRALRLRLRSIGLGRGSQVRLITRGPGGALLVEVDGCRVALGPGVARHVLVVPESQNL